MLHIVIFTVYQLAMKSNNNKPKAYIDSIPPGLPYISHKEHIYTYHIRVIVIINGLKSIHVSQR